MEVKKIIEYRHTYDKDVIFAYYLTGTFEIDAKVLLVINSKCNNVNYYNENGDFNNILTIPYNEIEKISNIINNSKLFNIDKIEFPPIWDGSEHEFYFKNNNKTKVINCFNLWYWDEYKSKSAKNAKILLNIYNQINDILLKYDVKMNLSC